MLHRMNLRSRCSSLLGLAALATMAGCMGPNGDGAGATLDAQNRSLIVPCDGCGPPPPPPPRDPYRKIASQLNGEADWDQDGIPDALELQLAQRFYPYLISDPSDRPFWHGLPWDFSTAKLYFRVRTYTPDYDGVNECSEPFACLELDFAEPWEWDQGRNDLTDHNGDSEFSQFLVSRKSFTGNGGTSWAIARGDAGYWGVLASGQDAHGGRRFSLNLSNWPRNARPKMYVSYAKHATYVTRNDCTSTKLGCFIFCAWERCDATGQDQLTRDYTDLGRLANIGSTDNSDGTIPGNHLGVAYADGFTGRFPVAGSCTNANRICPPPPYYNYYDQSMPFGSDDSNPYSQHFDQSFTAPGEVARHGFYWRQWIHNCAAAGYSGSACGLQIEFDKCGEASCVGPDGQYISHFTGAYCDGTESYYLPYNYYAYRCRPWDGQGECGTLRRTVTNRSYRYNGTCYANAWPNGNTLTDFVTVYR